MAAAIDIVSLDETKAFLNIDDTTYDTELASYITSASSLWIKAGGPGASSPAFDEWYDGGNSTISLRHRPVIEITSIVEAITGTTAYTLTEQNPGGGSSGAWGYSVNKELGLIVRRANGVEVRTTQGKKNIHVTYKAGFATAPEDVKHAVLLLILHQWETQRGGTRRQSSAEEYDPRAGFTMPRRVLEILDMYRIPGIA